MRKSTKKDLDVVHQYADTITTFIQELIQDESRSWVMTCQVLQEHQHMHEKVPFRTEQDRIAWLLGRSRELALKHLKYVAREKKKDAAILDAIRDYAQTSV